MGRCDGHGGKKRGWGDVTVDIQCDSDQRGVKGIRNMCQLMERCDGHGGDVKG